MQRRSVYADKLLAHTGLVFSDGAERTNRGKWNGHFRQRIGATENRTLVLEVGCNDGSLLAACAAAHPDTAFVGLDWKFRALHHAAERSKGLPNVAYLRARAQDLAELFAPDELSEIWLFHPDPPDRLFAEPFLLGARRCLKPGGTFAFKTDHPGYFQHALGLLGIPEPAALRARPKMRRKELLPPEVRPPASQVVTDRFSPTFVSADFWHDPAAQSAAATHAFAGKTTPYESRFVNKRLPIYYLELAAR